MAANPCLAFLAQITDSDALCNGFTFCGNHPTHLRRGERRVAANGKDAVAWVREIAEGTQTDCETYVLYGESAELQVVRVELGQLSQLETLAFASQKNAFVLSAGAVFSAELLPPANVPFTWLSQPYPRPVRFWEVLPTCPCEICSENRRPGHITAAAFAGADLLQAKVPAHVRQHMPGGVLVARLMLRGGQQITLPVSRAAQATTVFLGRATLEPQAPMETDTAGFLAGLVGPGGRAQPRMACIKLVKGALRTRACRRCGNFALQRTTRQTRSSDEAVTDMLRCELCGFTER